MTTFQERFFINVRQLPVFDHIKTIQESPLTLLVLDHLPAVRRGKPHFFFSGSELALLLLEPPDRKC